ncbi:hypothetical protein [Paludisphaera soli]|uniref:hypothetical protein n=1 Tax=Paludisphaera soli TaxID=2712865 RepID=UPI0013EAE1F9|nr:hypothetical protein [Paludisphaera soli]
MADPGLDRLTDRELDELEAKTCRDAVARVGPVTIRLCGRCRRILKTPKARQCFHCGNDWHDEAEP